MKTQHKKLLALLFTILALILEFIPYGVRMNWMTADPDEVRVTWHSYFSVLPFGYGDIFPLCTSALTILLLILTIACLRTDEGGCFPVVLSAAAGIASILALGMQVFLLGYISPLGLGITALLISAFFLNFKTNKEQNHG